MRLRPPSDGERVRPVMLDDMWDCLAVVLGGPAPKEEPPDARP